MKKKRTRRPERKIKRWGGEGSEDLTSILKYVHTAGVVWPISVYKRRTR